MQSRNFLVCSCLFLSFSVLQASSTFPKTRIFLEKNITDNASFLDSSIQQTENYISDYIKLLSINSFSGEWFETRAPTPEQPTYKHFENTKGFIETNPYETGSGIVLLDTQYVDKKFVYLSLDFQEVFKDVHPDNGVLKVDDLKVPYWYGDDLLRQGLISTTKDCVIKELTLNFTRQDTGEPFNPEKHKGKDALVMVKMDGGECLLSFETTLLTSLDERFLSQVWIFSLLYLLWCIPNMMVAISKFKEMDAIEKAEGLQFFLVFNINFYVSMWNNLFAQALAGNFGLLLVALFNFFIWASNFGTSLRCIQGRRNPCFLVASIFLTVCIRTIFVYSHTILLAVFISIPVIDIIKSFRGGSRPKYDFSLYFGALLPNLIIIAYLTLYEGNFVRLSTQPNLTKGFFLFVFLSFGFLPIQVEIKRFILRLRRERRYINAKDVSSEDMCPICMQGLTEQVEVKADSDEQIKTINEHRDDEDPRPLKTKTVTKIIKTECGHLFHEICLNEWFKIKAECPSCRKAVVDFM